MISLLQLGTVDYGTALRLQEKLVNLRKENRIGDVLLLLEHPPVITLGRNAKAVNVVASTEVLTQRGVEVFACDRGGDVTFHGPGQLVGYPIFDLRGFPSSQGNRKTLGAIEYVRRLEEVLIRTCADFRIATERIEKLTGVWTLPDSSGASGTDIPARPGARQAYRYVKEHAKIAAIGVHISRGVTSHGFALNVHPDLSFFDLIIPCGIADKAVTSMARELETDLSLERVAQSVARSFGSVFASQILWLQGLNELLGEPVGVPLKVPAELRALHKEDDISWA